MRDITWSLFPQFIAALYEGRRPFAWQLRLAQHLAEHGGWPALVNAPTGAGKSIPVAMHVFGNAVAACGGPRLPRRLVTVVNRRALVDNQHDVAVRLAEELGSARPGSLLADVAHALRSLTPRPGADPLQVVNLRGGLPVDCGWRLDPAVCTVVAATPDMWGSRALMRGYGTSVGARPWEAGLLTYDTVVAIDEAHLNRQIALTARQIRRLSERAATPVGVSPLQVMELTATPPPDSATQSLLTVDVRPDDLAMDPPLRARLTSAKPVRYSESPQWPRGTGKASPPHIAALADAVVDLRRLTVETAGAVDTVGCVVNRVMTAVNVAKALREQGLRVQLWTGRMRPYDLLTARRERPGLFTVSGDPEVDVLVATQTVEVGIDLDLAGMVTELASGSAVAQRVGRVNRLGLRDHAPIVVVGPARGDRIEDALPYRASELGSARDWLLEVEGSPEGLSPWAVTSKPPPAAAPRRLIHERLETGIVEQLADTSDRTFVEPDLDLWLREDLDPELDPVWIAPREFRGLEDHHLVSMLVASPPVQMEQFQARIADARAIAGKVLSRDWNGDTRVALYRPDSGITLLPSGEDAALTEIRPGSVLLIDAGHRFTRDGVVMIDNTRVTPSGVFWGSRELPHAVESTGQASAGLSFVGDETDETGVAWCLVLAGKTQEEAQLWFDEEGPARVTKAGWQVVMPPAQLIEEGAPPPWVVLQPGAVSRADELTCQEQSPRGAPVELAAHQEAVRERVEAVARAVGVTHELSNSLGLAGLHHDDGKCWPGFQAYLQRAARADGHDIGPRPGVLAKSGARSSWSLRRDRLRFIPVHWRHEQVSVAVAAGWYDVHDPLVLRLVGTSHGHGRAGFPHGTDGLHLLSGGVGLHNGDQWERVVPIARRLFDRGEWDMLVDATHEDYGYWGCAYLEALLRSADNQVSEEGS